MKIKEVILLNTNPIIIEMEDGDRFMRNSSDNWDQLYGNSSEGLFLSDCEILEKLYQEWKNKQAFGKARGGGHTVRNVIESMKEVNPKLTDIEARKLYELMLSDLDAEST